MVTMPVSVISEGKEGLKKLNGSLEAVLEV